MNSHSAPTLWLRLRLNRWITFFAALVALTPTRAVAEPRLNVDGQVALASLVALSDQHIQQLLVSMEILAKTSEVQSGDWNAFRGAFSVAAKTNVAALNWFVLPDGSYSSIQNGREPGNLKSRPYFAKLMSGERVIGDLVASKNSGKSVAIVGVPVFRNKKVIGALGASVYLDKLSALLESEMGLDETSIFYSFDEKSSVGLGWDPTVILTDPMQMVKETGSTFKTMLTREEGTIEYSFRGKKRKVLFRKSEVTGWWYAFGRIPQREEQASAGKPDRG